MLRRLLLVGSGRLSLLRCRRPNQQHIFPAVCSYWRELSDSPAAKDPRWVMLQCLYGTRINDSIVADPNTVADSRTTAGHHLRVSLARAAPPASSVVYYDWPDSLPGQMNYKVINVIAAHGDSVLLEMSNNNHFVYRVGSAARPPSLTRLPPAGHLDFQIREGHTGLLQRGQDDLLVIQHNLKGWFDESELYVFQSEFYVHRLGTSKWELEQAGPIIDYQDVPGNDLSCWATMAPIPVGDRYLCCLGTGSHFLLSDMADERSPKVRYVPLPPDLSCDDGDSDDEDDIPPYVKPLFTTTICAAGASRVKFVRIETRCCHGGPGKYTCASSCLAFTINTWTMNLSMADPLTWVKDGVLDCKELWALPDYEGLPRACLESPIVSLDNPDIICFSVSNFDFVSYPDRAIWIIQLNMRTKSLLSSVVKYTTELWKTYHHLPARL